MAYYDEDRQVLPPAPGGKAERVVAVALGLVLTSASVVSLIHLSQRWQEAAPHREARAIEAANRQAEAEAARVAEAELARSAEIGDPAESDAALAAFARDKTAPPPRPAVSAEVSRPERQVDVGPVRWINQPRFRIPPEILAKTGPDRVTVRFECRVNRNGGLYGCTGTETPGGFGVLPAARAALADARVQPMTHNGQPVEGVVTFGHQWTRSRAIAAPAADRLPAAPAASEPPAPAPEPAAEPAVVEGASPPPRSEEPPPGEG
jgi:hypothetical protein